LNEEEGEVQIRKGKKAKYVKNVKEVEMEREEETRLI
jgi:hypothetical protein